MLEQIHRREYDVVIAYGGGGAGGSCFAGGGGSCLAGGGGGGAGGSCFAGGGGGYAGHGHTAAPVAGLVECQYCARFGRLGATCEGCGAPVAPRARRQPTFPPNRTTRG